MKKFIVPLLLVCLLVATLSVNTMRSSAETADGEAKTASESNSDALIPDETLVTYGMLLKIKDELRQEIVSELLQDGVSVQTTYNDICVNQGELLILSPDSEIIYRGGGAIAITSSEGQTEGITDMSANTEIFSGMPLEYGHIYHSSASEATKAILVTGDRAYFTVRGDYEIG